MPVSSKSKPSRSKQWSFGIAVTILSSWGRLRLLLSLYRWLFQAGNPPWLIWLVPFLSLNNNYLPQIVGSFHQYPSLEFVPCGFSFTMGLLTPAVGLDLSTSTEFLRVTVHWVLVSWSILGDTKLNPTNPVLLIPGSCLRLGLCL